MNVLITGSSGQIGTNLALALLKRGDAILGIDKRPNAWSTAPSPTRTPRPPHTLPSPTLKTPSAAASPQP